MGKESAGRPASVKTIRVVRNPLEPIHLRFHEARLKRSIAAQFAPQVARRPAAAQTIWRRVSERAAANGSALGAAGQN